MSRISEKFKQLAARRKKALVVFVTAGYPSLKATRELVLAFEKDGADLIELGVPFSDPLADGPVIQESSRRALLKKTALSGILSSVREIRRHSQIPILLMGYLNPILSYGLERFARDAAAAGVDGVIVPDLPPDEGEQISRLFAKSKLDHVYLLAPTSTSSRIQKVARLSKGFVYYVSMTGITGMKSSFSKTLAADIRRVRRYVRIPVCVGFGVSTPADAKALSSVADGVIVGSAIVKPLLTSPAMPSAAFSRRYVRPLAKALEKPL